MLFAFAVYALSHRVAFVANRIDSFLALCCAFATLHYFYLFDRNNGDLNWVVGAYITVSAVCAVLQTARSLLAYSIFVAGLSALMTLRPSGTAYVVFLPGMLTTLLLANLGLYSRLKLHSRLQQDHKRIESLFEEGQRTKKALMRANRDLESFSYSVAHDLRSPLRTITGFSQILLEDFAPRLDDEGKQHLNNIANGAQTMAKLIDALLNLAKLTRAEVKRERVNLAEIAESILEQLARSQPDRRVELVVMNHERMTVNADPELVGVLLSNLLGNAWKFTDRTKSARIEIGCRSSSGTMEYFVKDNGAGFDMAQAKTKLFAPFQRLHTAKEFPGTGVGLATVQRIVDRHGGRVWAEGVVNEGATFYFTLET